MLKAIVFQDPDRVGLVPGEERWLAHGLKHTIIGTGGSRGEAIHHLMLNYELELQVAQDEAREPFEGVPETPDWVKHLPGAWEITLHPPTRRES